MNMRKPLALLLAAGLTLGLAACGGGATTESPSGGSSETPAGSTGSGSADCLPHPVDLPGRLLCRQPGRHHRRVQRGPPRDPDHL